MFYFSIKVILFLNACSEFIIRTIETLQTVSVATAPRPRAPARARRCLHNLISHLYRQVVSSKLINP